MKMLIHILDRVWEGVSPSHDGELFWILGVLKPGFGSNLPEFLASNFFFFFFFFFWGGGPPPTPMGEGVGVSPLPR